MTFYSKLLRAAIVSAASFALFGSAAFADVQVQQTSGNWQVDADAEPVVNVLEQIAKQAGIKVSGTNKMISNPDITGHWEGDLETVFARMLRGVDYVTETKMNTSGEVQITRVIVLSGEVGQAPSAKAVRSARRIPAPATAADTEKARADGARVTSLLEAKARVAAGMTEARANGTTAEANQTPPTRGSSGITRNEDGTFEIDPATQARMAEATRRSLADLEALTNALRQNEENTGD